MSEVTDGNAGQEQLVLIVPDGGIREDLAPGEFERHGPREWVRRWRGSAHGVDVAAVRSQLDHIQRQIDSLLSALEEPAEGRFRLSDIEIGLAVTAEGSIGVATVGAEVSINLTYSRAS
jgi:hypothetical protein